MTARALQQVAVRMHHDPQFVEQVYDDRDRALADEDLGPSERLLLTQPDRRAWGADAERRQRVLSALELEFSACCAMAEQATGGRDCLLGFFSSSAFHQCVRSFQPLVFAFGRYLVGRSQEGLFGGNKVAALARLELAAAKVRRTESPSPPTEGACGPLVMLRRAPWTEVLELPEGTLELFQAMGPRRTAAGPSQLPSLSSDTSEHLIIERAQPDGSLSIGYLPEALFTILTTAGEGVPRTALVACARAEGAEPPQDEEVLQSLESDRLLVPLSDR